MSAIRKQFLIFLFSFFAVPGFLLANEDAVIFEENKNQWPSQVKFQANIRGGMVFLEQNTFTYVIKENKELPHDFPSDGSVITNYHAFRVNYQNSRTDVVISGNGVQQGCRNYFKGNDRSKWAEGVKLFSQVNYKGLYQGIDMTVYQSESNLKYDLLVQPGGNVNSISLKYEGLDGMSLEYGHLFLKTSVGSLIEQRPYAYQVINGEKQQVPCEYILKKNTVGFRIGKYDPALPLIIDPILIVSTFSGSTADNRGFTATYDAAGNIYTGGMAIGIGYPVTSGAFQQVHNGGTWDAVVSKLNPTGTGLLFSTFYGGTGNDQAHSIMVNNQNELFVVGRTSSTDFPVTAGVFCDTLSGLHDMFVGKISSTGGLLASTYIGGNAEDCINVTIGNGPTWAPLKYSRGDDGKSELIVDANSNVYVTACTQSTNFPTSAGAYDNTLSGTQDAIVFKLNSSLTNLLFSTYLGGSDYEAGYGIKTDNTGKIYITGGTSSSDLFPPAAVTSVINPTYGGSVDGFIAVFDPAQVAAAQLMRGTYLGTALYDQSYFIEIDASNDLYIYGQTKGPYPVTAGVYSNPNSGMFIHKITGNLQTTSFSTVIGNGTGTVNLAPTAFLVDSCQTIYISGFGRCSLPWAVPDSGSVLGMPLTANALQSTTDGCDLYFAVLSPDAKSLVYATYWGGNIPTPEHVDGGTSRFDKRGVIYHSCCASCGTLNGFPTTPGAFSNTNNGPICNNAVVKMDMAVNPVAKANVTSSTTGCAPFPVCFSNTGSAASNYIWDFGDGNTSTLPSPCYTYSFAGTYTITLYAIDSIGICGFIDTSMVAVTIGQSPLAVINSSPILCNGGTGSATVTPTGGISPYTYAWLPSGGSTNIATGLGTGNYTVTISDAVGCTSTVSIAMAQPPALSPSITVNGTSCGLATGSASGNIAGGTPGYSYNWSNGSSTSSATGLSAGNYSVLVTDNNGCTTSQVFSVGTVNGPTATVTAGSMVSCNGGNDGSASGVLAGGTGPYTYVWSPASAGTNQVATGLTAGNYTLTITDAMGCIAQSTVTITEPPPLVINISHTNVLCLGGNSGSATALVSGGTGNYTYGWSTTPAQTNPSIAGLSAGTYTVLVTDGNGCTSTSTVTILQPTTSISISTATSGSACGTNANGGISTTVASGNSPFSYSWYPGGQNTPAITNIGAGTYTVIVTDATGCTDTTITTFAGSVQPLADFNYMESISCEGMGIQLSDSSTNALSWYWEVPGVGTSTSPNPSFLFPYNGTYTITLIVSNPPCSDTLSKPVTIGDFAGGLDLLAANVFSPNADGDNDCFYPSVIDPITGLPIHSLIQCTHLEVFDRWGVQMYESLGLNGINCWNGNNKNDAQPATDGTYYYLLTLGETTIKGYVTLARHK